MRYFIGFLVTIGLIVILIMLLFHHGGGGKVPVTKAPLITYANTDTVVRETIDEKINAVQDHRQTVITVGRDSATIEVRKGYDGEVVKSQSYPMTATAYASFLRALQHASFTQGNDDSSLKDERGYCPLGNRYIYEIVQAGSDIERYWATSCSGTPATFKGKTNTVLELFRLQVPDYNDLVNSTDTFFGL